MKRAWLISTALVVATASTGRSQLMTQDAAKQGHVAYVAEPQSVTAGKPGVLLVHFRVMESYHVNSHTPKSELLIPTALRLTPADGVKAGDLEYPAGKQFSFSFDSKEKLDVYAGDFTVKVPVTAAKGEHTVTGALRYQACDNAQCYPPKSLPVEVLFTAK